jgi:type II secretory pathway pseudopilin PulG
MRKRQCGATRDDGFTIVELVAATGILIIVIIGAMSGIMFASQSAIMSGRRVEALSLANQQIELARNLPFDDVGTIVPSNGLAGGKIPDSQTLGPYTVTTDIAYGTYAASPASRYKTMSVIVSWADPVPGRVTVSTVVAGASGTQDYNFGIVTLQVKDDSPTPQNLAGVTVNLVDINNRTYSMVTTESGMVRFDYVPSGNITFSSTKTGYIVDAPTAPTCVANTTTNYGPVTAHRMKSAVVNFTCPTGTIDPDTVVYLINGPNSPGSEVIGSDNTVTFTTELINGSYTYSTDANLYSFSPTMLTITGSDVTVSVAMSLNPAKVVATRAAGNGTIYVWNEDGTSNQSKATRTSSPFTSTFYLTHPDSDVVTYYFTKTNVFSTLNPLTVTDGQIYALTVN